MKVSQGGSGPSFAHHGAESGRGGEGSDSGTGAEAGPEPRQIDPPERVVAEPLAAAVGWSARAEPGRVSRRDKSAGGGGAWTTGASDGGQAGATAGSGTGGGGSSADPTRSSAG